MQHFLQNIPGLLHLRGSLWSQGNGVIMLYAWSKKLCQESSLRRCDTKLIKSCRVPWLFSANSFFFTLELRIPLKSLRLEIQPQSIICPVVTLVHYSITKQILQCGDMVIIWITYIVDVYVPYIVGWNCKKVNNKLLQNVCGIKCIYRISKNMDWRKMTITRSPLSVVNNAWKGT